MSAALLLLSLAAPAWAATPRHELVLPPLEDEPLPETITLDYRDASLETVARDMARATGRNLVYEGNIRDTITVISGGPVPREAAWAAFMSMVEVAGYAAVSRGATVRLVPDRQSSSEAHPVVEGQRPPAAGDRWVTWVLPAGWGDPDQLSSVVKQLMGDRAQLITHKPTGTMILTDTAARLERVSEVLEALRTEDAGEVLELYFLQHAAAADVVAALEKLYKDEEEPAAKKSTRRRSRRSRRRRSRRAQEPTPEAKLGPRISKALADERTNAVLVRATPASQRAVAALIDRLDVDVDPSGQARLRVVYVEHADAAELADLLSRLVEQQEEPATRRRGRRPRQEEAEDTASAAQLLSGDIRVTSDEATNALVLMGNPEQLRVLEALVEKLDIARRQVFVEVVILELSGEDRGELGVGAHRASDAGDGLALGSAQLNASSATLDPSALLSGAAMGVYGEPVEVEVTGADGAAQTVALPAFGVALNALSASQSVEILSAPSVLTTENEEARVIVGRNVPFPVSTGFDSNNNPIVSYQREDVAITVQITPQISAGGEVILEIFQEVTEIEEDTSGLDVSSAGFITSKRSTEAVVQVPDNQTVVLSGLMAETRTEVETGLPLLGDLPLVGALFEGRRLSERSTELMVFLTPHVVEGPEDLAEIYELKALQRQAWLERYRGGAEVEGQAEAAELLDLRPLPR